MDIGSWLRGLGLERYEPAFRDNAVDAEVLPELTESDLEKLGILLGDRKRMLRAIDEIRTTPLPALAGPESAPSRADRNPLRTGAGDRPRRDPRPPALPRVPTWAPPSY